MTNSTESLKSGQHERAGGRAEGPGLEKRGGGGGGTLCLGGKLFSPAPSTGKTARQCGSSKRNGEFLIREKIRDCHRKKKKRSNKEGNFPEGRGQCPSARSVVQ